MAIGSILFFLMMLAPQSWQFVKIPLVIISFMLLLIHYVRAARKKLSAIVLIWFAILLLYGTIWSFLGVLRGNLGALDCFRLNVIWPILFLIYVLYIDSYDKFETLIKTMVWATIAISVYNISMLLSVINLIPDINSYLKIDNELSSGVGVYSGFTQLNSINIGSLAFLAPFVLVLLIMNVSTYCRISKVTLASSVVLSIITIFISGRRVLLFEMLATSFLVIVLNYLYNVSESRKLIMKNIIKFYIVILLAIVSSGVALLNYLNWDANQFGDRFFNAFESGNVRHMEIVALFNGFSEHPIMGVGFGKGVSDYVASYERPWTYEVSYSVILYATGILGSGVYLWCIGYIYYYLVISLKLKPSKIGITIAMLVSFTCFLIANATNPYLGSYDFMWMLFLPIAYINVTYTNITYLKVGTEARS